MIHIFECNQAEQDDFVKHSIIYVKKVHRSMNHIVDFSNMIQLGKPGFTGMLRLPDKPGFAGMTSARGNEINTGKLRSENEEMHANTL